MAEELLTREELDFISELLDAPARRKALPSFKLEGSWEASEMLSNLAAHARLALDAEFDAFCLSFPLRLVEDEFHAQHLELAPPTIYERGPRLRAWRLQLPTPVALLEADGGKTDLRAHEISPRGLLVSAARRRPPAHIDLCLPLPDGTSVPLSAHRIRETPEGLTAYALENESEQDTRRLRRFLFAQHRRLHPELGTEQPDDLV